MVDGHDGTVVDGVFTSTGRSYFGFAASAYFGFAASAPVFIGSLLRGSVVAITLTGKSSFFSVAIASTNALNSSVHMYEKNHHVAFHYSSAWGRVNSDWDGISHTHGTFAQHRVIEGGPFTAVLTLRGSDRTVSFSVNGVPQDGVWPLPTTDAFYLMLATNGGGEGNNIAVTDVTVAMADLA